MQVSDRCAALREAKNAFKKLEANKAAGRRQLGAAREHLNQVYNLTDPEQVWDAVARIKALANHTANHTTNQQ